MRQLILSMSVSLDGFVARTDGVIDWLPSATGADHGDRRRRANLEVLGQIGAIVMGRRAYEDMFKGWSGSDNPMAVLMNSLPKVVFSQSLSGWPGATRGSRERRSSRRSRRSSARPARTWSSSAAPPPTPTAA